MSSDDRGASSNEEISVYGVLMVRFYAEFTAELPAVRLGRLKDRRGIKDVNNC